MSNKRLLTAFLSLGLGLTLGLAGTAGARTYSLAAGSGGQLQIGGGLPLPIQATCNATCKSTVFPPLLIPPASGATVMGTLIKTSAQRLTVPTGVLSKPAAFKILGQNANNPALYAVATNLKYTWPAAQAVFSTQARAGLTNTIVNFGGGKKITYSNALARKFGGPAQFRLAPGAPGPAGGAGPAGDLNTAAPVSIYLIPPSLQPFTPPCNHPAFGGAEPRCVALIGNAVVTGLAAAGGGQPATPATVTTPGGTPMAFTMTASRVRNGPKPGNGPVRALAAGPTPPVGQISLFAFGPTGNGVGTGFTNMASSSGLPWTTGKLVISATLAGGGGEVWAITGKDLRTAGGAGTIQMVSGAVSLRTATGDNANRGWVRLVLTGPTDVPALSPAALAATAGLMLLVAGYTMRRRFYA